MGFNRFGVLSLVLVVVSTACTPNSIRGTARATLRAAGTGSPAAARAVAPAARVALEGLAAQVAPAETAQVAPAAPVEPVEPGL